MSTTRLLALTSALEAMTGLALMIDPALVARLLLGADLAGAGLAVGRLAGFGLFALGLACWPNAAAGRGQASAVLAMLSYSLLATLYLGGGGAAGEFDGWLLWPAVAFHAVVTVLLVRAWLLERRARASPD
jgi:hypothetical protein